MRMNRRLKGIVTVILIVIIGLVAVSGIGYIRQRMAEDQGVKYLKQRNIRKHMKNLIVRPQDLH